MVYHFKIHKEDPQQYWAECIELNGCVTQGRDFEDLKKNMEEALNLYLNESEMSTYEFPEPIPQINDSDIIGVPVNYKIAFALNMRKVRKMKKMTQKETAEKLGMKNLYSYQRLESPKKANPNLSTIAKIKKVFPEIRVDDIIISNVLN
jgi:antitoxin HicB